MFCHIQSSLNIWRQIVRWRGSQSNRIKLRNHLNPGYYKTSYFLNYFPLYFLAEISPSAAVTRASPTAAAPPALQAGQVLLQLKDVESIIGQLQQLRMLIPELQAKVAVSQLALAEAEAKLQAREKEKKEESSQTSDEVQVVDRGLMEQQAGVVEQQRRLLEERVRALHAATSHTDTLASELVHYQRLFAYVLPSLTPHSRPLRLSSCAIAVLKLIFSAAEESLKQLQSTSAAQQQAVEAAVMERDALVAELKQGAHAGAYLRHALQPFSSALTPSPPPPPYCRNCAAVGGQQQVAAGEWRLTRRVDAHRLATQPTG